LQLIKLPLFRAIDLCGETLDILAPALKSVQFRADQIQMDPSINAAAEANEMVVKQGIPFRDAYKIIGEKYKKS
jgi:argininosuccinate lyase